MSDYVLNSSGLMNREEAAEWLGISLRKLDDLVHHNVIPSFKLGGRRLFDPEQLRKWVQEQHSATGVV